MRPARNKLNRLDVALRISAANHGNGRLDVGPGQSLMFRIAGIWRRPRLAGVATDECGEYLHHGGVVFCGIPGNPLEGVDAADAHVELVQAKLLDGLGVTVGHLPLLGQLMCATLPVISLFGITPQEAEIQGSKDQRPTGNQARGQCQQSSPGIIQCRLVQRSRG